MSKNRFVTLQQSDPKRMWSNQIIQLNLSLRVFFHHCVPLSLYLRIKQKSPIQSIECGYFKSPSVSNEILLHKAMKKKLPTWIKWPIAFFSLLLFLKDFLFFLSLHTLKGISSLEYIHKFLFFLDLWMWMLICQLGKFMVQNDSTRLRKQSSHWHFWYIQIHTHRNVLLSFSRSTGLKVLHCTYIIYLKWYVRDSPCALCSHDETLPLPSKSASHNRTKHKI